MAGKQHTYSVKVVWTGNTGSGTSSARGYTRDYNIMAPGKSTIEGSSDPSFRGDPTRWNPEELLLASLSACQPVTNSGFWGSVHKQASLSRHTKTRLPAKWKKNAPALGSSRP